jgi:subtilisin family serine protease
VNTVRLAAVLLLGAALMGCQGKKSQERKRAPTGKQDVGILLETQDATVIDGILEANPAAQVRTINPNHGLYEIFGVERRELQKAAPQAELFSNEFFDFKLMSVPAPDGLNVEGLNPCKEASEYPTAVASVLQPTVTGNTFTVELGTKVVISTANSQANPTQPGALKTALVIMPPGTSRLSQSVTLGDKLEIQTDALGAYQVFVVAQDSRDVCALDAIRFIATANRAVQSVNEGGRVDLNQLKHLANVNAQEAWAKSAGEGVLIAIVDTGVHYNHPMLSANMEHNRAETAGNGADEDRNGFVDDQIGYDFINSDPFPYDDDGHGTHVAGLAAARQFGLANKARILAVKAMTSIGGDAGSIAGAVIYAVDRGAKIINMSLGSMGPAPHPLIARAMDYAKSKNVLVVVASGNGDPQTGLGLDIDQMPVWPASLTHENILSVAASDSNNALTPYSNYGKIGVDVTAPGGFGREPLLSTAFENPAGGKFVAMSGTSMAAPVVSGVCALVWALNPNLKATEVKAIVINSGPEQEDLKRVTVSGRRLNALKAVSTVAPANALF